MSKPEIWTREQAAAFCGLSDQRFRAVAKEHNLYPVEAPEGANPRMKYFLARDVRDMQERRIKPTRRKIDLAPAELRRLTALSKTDRAAQIVVMFATGFTGAAIAEILGVSKTRAYEYLDRYIEHGIDGLHVKRHRQRKEGKS